MTQNEKDLLLKDLYARLPYGVKTKVKCYDNVWKLQAIYTNGTMYATRDIGYPIETYFQDCKPYLFPLSSMDEELTNELYSKLTELELKAINDEIEHSVVSAFEIDFYHKHHIDYRGLIPMGLAIDASGLNIY